MLKHYVNQIMQRTGALASAVRGDGSLEVRPKPNPDLAPVPLPHINISEGFGQEMAVNAAFSGTPTLMYDENLGTPTEYNTTNEVGANFIFNSTDQAFNGTMSIDASDTQNGDTMQLDNGACPTCIALTGHVFITKWETAKSNEVTIFAWDTVGGEMIGNSVPLSSYINVNLFNVWQSITIPFIDLGMTGAETDAWRFRTDSAAGEPNAPDYYLDLISMQEGGGGVEYSTLFAQPPNSIFYASTLAITAVSPMGAGKTIDTLDIDVFKYYHLPALENGLTNIIQSQGVQTAAVTFHDLVSNIELAESTMEVVTYDSVTGYALIKISVDFKSPLVLNSSLGDFSKIILNDNLSTFITKAIYLGGSFEFIT